MTMSVIMSWDSANGIKIPDIGCITMHILVYVLNVAKHSEPTSEKPIAPMSKISILPGKFIV